MTPMPTMPAPETAVNDPARSMVRRMKCRLSIARSCSGAAGLAGSGAAWGCVTPEDWPGAVRLSSTLRGQVLRVGYRSMDTTIPPQA